MAPPARKMWEVSRRNGPVQGLQDLAEKEEHVSRNVAGRAPVVKKAVPLRRRPRRRLRASGDAVVTRSGYFRKCRKRRRLLVSVAGLERARAAGGVWASTSVTTAASV